MSAPDPDATQPLPDVGDGEPEPGVIGDPDHGVPGDAEPLPDGDADKVEAPADVPDEPSADDA